MTEFRDPGKGQDLRFEVVPAAQLDVIAHQRKARPAHVKNLVASIRKLGFLVPVVAIERDGTFVVIDGQHRVLAARELGLKELPVVVVPEDVAPRMMSLNVEKDLNIRERSFVALAIYRDALESDAAKPEKSLEDAIEHAHYVTLGVAYEKAGRLSGSAFESILKRCDGFLKTKLEDAYATRQERGAQVVEADGLVKAVAKELESLGVENAYISTVIIAHANPIKGTRKAASFDETFEKLLDKLRGLRDDPEKARRIVGG